MQEKSSKIFCPPVGCKKTSIVQLLLIMKNQLIEGLRLLMTKPDGTLLKSARSRVSEFLGVEYTTITGWLNGRNPQERMIAKIETLLQSDFKIVSQKSGPKPKKPKADSPDAILKMPVPQHPAIDTVAQNDACVNQDIAALSGVSFSEI